jgi:hypothetical protein
MVSRKENAESLPDKEVSVGGIRRSRSNSRHYRLFKIHRVTKQADVKDFALCVIVSVVTMCYS